jgi:ATP-dependent DNA helicase RecG
MHIRYEETNRKETDVSERETLVLEILKENPSVTLDEVAVKIGKSVRTVKIIVKKMQEDGKLERVGAKKSGKWKVL